MQMKPPTLAEMDYIARGLLSGLYFSIDSAAVEMLSVLTWVQTVYQGK